MTFCVIHLFYDKNIVFPPLQVLQGQLQFLQQQKLEEPKADRSSGTAPSEDTKGKAAVTTSSSSASVPDCGRHGEIEEVDTD